MTFQRSGNRAADQLRPIRITRGFTIHAEGSVLIEFGDTKVLCTASVEEKVPPHKRGSGEGWVTAEYGMLPRATHTRGDREAARGKQSGAGVVRMDRINRNILFTCLGSPTKPVFDVTGPVTLQQGDKILLCSDGLWGSLNDIDIVRHLSTDPVSQAVPDLVEAALRNGGDHSDNVTVIALEWETPDSFESTRGISTDSISDGVFASTIQAGVLDTMVEDLDDAAIERSIAEINEAIKRSAARKS
ncbi:MAG TPA: hypothetical protein VK981_05845 [Ramlibacter sp.]|nr:hypothetical protein [Ramlibacter sp.]